MIQNMCSHCHTMVDVDRKECPGCGHDAHVARSECSCARCGYQRPRTIPGSRRGGMNVDDWDVPR